MDAIDCFCPKPQRCTLTGSSWRPPATVRVRIPQELDDPVVRQRLQRHLGAWGSSVAFATPDDDIACDLRVLLIESVAAESIAAEGYRLRVDAAGVVVEVGTPEGLFYAVSTLGQWLRIHRPSALGESHSLASTALPALEVDDWPDFASRGVMLDISRNKMPRLSQLEDLIDLLADCKVNHLQLYTEHTFAYQGHEIVWRDASPLTAEDVRRLDTYCQQRHIELVANQNSFGHLHRWLIHDPYRPLAECPEGIEHPFSDDKEPFSLCPIDDRAIALLEDLYDQLLPNFRSSWVNVGLDETLDLGLGRSADACREHGRGRVYLDYLQRVHRALAERGKRMMYWGDVVLEHPELIAQLPADAVVLAWGYEANYPFAEKAEQFAASGLDFWMCPGTSTWSSFAGRGKNALLNLARAAQEGHRHGSRGYLVTEWGDHGHLQPLPTSYLGFLAGASFAWNVRSAEDPEALPWTKILDLHAFETHYRSEDGASLADVAMQLANVYLETNAPPPGGKKINGSALFFAWIFAHKPSAERRGQGMTPQHLDATRRAIAQAMDDLASIDPGSADLEPANKLVWRELRWLGDVLDLACRLALGRLAAGLDAPLHELPEDLRRQLADEVQDLVERRQELWMVRNRPGGWELSAQKMLRLQDLLLSEQPEGREQPDGPEQPSE